MATKSQRNKIFAIAAIVIAALLQYLDPETRSNNAPTTHSDNNTEQSAAGFTTLQKAVANKASHVWFEATTFEIRKVLADDNHGSRHQRFLVKKQGLPTLLVAHNIDLAPRAPLQAGLSVTIKGRYEWNEKGGVIHWTHHDPSGRKAGGWISLNNQRYD